MPNFFYLLWHTTFQYPYAMHDILDYEQSDFIIPNSAHCSEEIKL